MRGAVAAVAVVAACGGARAPEASRAVATAAWSEARSAHFVVRGDRTGPELEARAAHLERLWLAVGELYASLVGGVATPRTQLAVVELKDCELFAALAGPARRWYVADSTDFGMVPVAASCGNADDAGPVLLARVMNATAFTTLPAWVAAGLTQYVQTIDLVDDELRVGAPPGLVAPVSQSVRELVATDRAGDAGWARAAWTLVHLLLDDDAHRARFTAYLAAVAAGTPSRDAWPAAFADVPAHVLEDAYDAHVERKEYRVRRIALPRRGAVDVAGARLGTDDVLDTWMVMAGAGWELDGQLPPDGVAALDRELARVSLEHPAWPDGMFWRAAILAHAGPRDRAAARIELLDYLDVRPSDGRALAGVVALGLDDAQQGDPLAALDAAAAAALEPHVRALARVAIRPGELDAVARYYAALGRPETGLNFARRAVQTSPVCDRCELTLAILLGQQGRRHEAIARVERAIVLADAPAAAERYRRLMLRLAASNGP
jgi:tetratricopeptide (TPR) repeat protein